MSVDAGFKDRSTGLMVFGIIQIILGALCALLVPFMALSMAVASAGAQKAGTASMNTAGMIFGILFYALLAAFFITMGIGSMRARRWARALMLVVSWMWLVVGILAIFMMVFILPGIFARMPDREQMPGGFELVFMIIMLAFMSVIYIVLPAVFVFFYRSPHVKATCEQRDPVTRWTDRCPLPVLGLALLFGYGACFMPAMGLYNWAFPFFGTILSGPPAAAIVLAVTGLWAWLAWALFKVKPVAWWTALAAILLMGTSSTLTFSRGNLVTFYEKMGFPPEQLEMMHNLMPADSFMMTAVGASMLVFVGYLIFTRRFFDRPAGAS